MMNSLLSNALVNHELRVNYMYEYVPYCKVLPSILTYLMKRKVCSCLPNCIIYQLLFIHLKGCS